MDTNASLGRFYAFTTNTPANLQSSTNSPGPQSRRHSSGSGSISDDDGRNSQPSHPAERAPPGYGVHHGPYPTQNPPPFPHNRPATALATVYVDDSPYIPPNSSHIPHASNFVETGRDAPFNPPIPSFNNVLPSSMASTTFYPTTYRRNSGDISPTGSNGSHRSDLSGGVSGSSQGSVSSGVLSNGSPPRDPTQHGHDVFPPIQRVVPPPGFNPEHYPAYDQNYRRVGIELGRFGTDPRQPDQPYYRPRTHTYPSVGTSHVMGSPHDHQQISTLPSSEMQLLPMHTDDLPDLRYEHVNDHVIPGQTRIHLPSASTPQSQSYDNSYGNSSSTDLLRAGDDASIPTSDNDVRRFLGLSPDQELSLNALADPPVGQRPGQSIPTLSQLAILGSPQKRLTLQEIYQALEDRFEWFRLSKDDKSWQNSIRHNLSLYKCFRRIAKPITEPGKGSYWVVDYSWGAGTKRPRKRNKRPTKAQLRAMEQQEQQGQEQQEQAVPLEDESSAEDDEGFPSPNQGIHDISIDPALQIPGHQVGQGRTTRSSARSAARRGNSPYAQGVPNTGVRQGRQTSAAATSVNIPGIRQSSAMFGQPSFGQPSLAPPSFNMFGQPPMDTRATSTDWQPTMGQPGVGQNLYLPPPHSSMMNSSVGAMQMDPTYMRPSPNRSHSMPSHMAQNMDMGLAPFAQLPPLPGIDQLRDARGRFVTRETAQPPSGGPSQQFTQGSSRGTRHTRVSSGSSRE